MTDQNLDHALSWFLNYPTGYSLNDKERKTEKGSVLKVQGHLTRNGTFNQKWQIQPKRADLTRNGTFHQKMANLTKNCRYGQKLLTNHYVHAWNVLKKSAENSKFLKTLYCRSPRLLVLLQPCLWHGGSEASASRPPRPGLERTRGPLSWELRASNCQTRAVSTRSRHPAATHSWTKLQKPAKNKIWKTREVDRFILAPATIWHVLNVKSRHSETEVM